MALLWSDGFEDYADSADFLMSYPGSVLVGGTTFSVAGGRFGGKCLTHVGTSATSFAKSTAPLTQDGAHGFAFKAKKPFEGLVLFAFIHPSGVVLSLTINRSPNSYDTKFRFVLKTGTDTVVGVTDYISEEVWHYLEVKIQPQSGLLEMRLNETLFFFSTTIPFAFSSWSGFFYSLSAYAPDGYISLDDLYSIDSANIVSNARDFLGSITIETLKPAKDGKKRDAVPSPDHSRNNANGQLYVMLGGLNIDGVGLVTALPVDLQGPQPNRKIWPIFGLPNFVDLWAGQNNTLQSPIYGGTQNLFGPEMTLMKAAQAFDGATVNIFKLARPGSAISKDIDPAGWSADLVGGLLAVLDADLAGIQGWFSTAACKVPAIIWGQGEVDATDDTASTRYYYELKKTLLAVRANIAARFGADNEIAPIVIVDLHPSIPPGVCPFASRIREAHAKIAAELPQVRVVDTSSIPTQTNTVYFTSQGFQDLGNLIFDTVKAMMPHSDLVNDLSSDGDLSYLSVGVGAVGYETFEVSPLTRSRDHVHSIVAKVDAKLVSGFGGLQPAYLRSETAVQMGDPITVSLPDWRRYHSTCPVEPILRGRAWLPEDFPRSQLGFFFAG